jgi:hypothetical protein
MADTYVPATLALVRDPPTTPYVSRSQTTPEPHKMIGVLTSRRWSLD